MQNKIEIGQHVRVRKPEDVQQLPIWSDHMQKMDEAVLQISGYIDDGFPQAIWGGHTWHLNPSWLTPVYPDVNGDWVELGERVEASDWNDFRTFCTGILSQYTIGDNWPFIIKRDADGDNDLGLMSYRYIQKIKPVDKPEPTPQEQDGHSCHMTRTLLGDIRRRGEFIRDNPSHKNVRVYGSEIVKKIDILMETSTPQEQHESLINRLKAMSQEEREEWIFRFNECEDLSEPEYKEGDWVVHEEKGLCQIVSQMGRMAKFMYDGEERVSSIDNLTPWKPKEGEEVLAWDHDWDDYPDKVFFDGKYKSKFICSAARDENSQLAIYDFIAPILPEKPAPILGVGGNEVKKGDVVLCWNEEGEPKDINFFHSKGNDQCFVVSVDTDQAGDARYKHIQLYQK